MLLIDFCVKILFYSGYQISHSNPMSCMFSVCQNNTYSDKIADKSTSSSRIEEWILRAENNIIELFVKGVVQAHITHL